MAKVTITIATKTIELNPGEEAGIMQLTLTGPQNFRMVSELESNVFILPDVRTGEYHVEVQRLHPNGIGLEDPIVGDFVVTLDQVRTYEGPASLSILVTK